MNELTSLDVSQNTELTSLWCINNQLTQLDVSKNSKLIDLTVTDNLLTSLDVSKNTKLVQLLVSRNLLASLDASHCPALKNLWANDIPLKNIHATIQGRSIRLTAEGSGYVELFLSSATLCAEAIPVPPASFSHWTQSGNSTAHPAYIDLEFDRDYDLTAHFFNPPTITSDFLPNAMVGTPYQLQLEASSDTPITWTLDSGTLPVGLSLSAAGVISGTPSANGAYYFTAKAENDQGSDIKALSILVVKTIFSTRYEANFWNWVMFFLLFGWIWMWFT